MIQVHGRRTWPLRYCCGPDFARLVGAMSCLEFLLLATIGERVPIGVS